MCTWITGEDCKLHENKKKIHLQLQENKEELSIFLLEMIWEARVLENYAEIVFEGCVSNKSVKPVKKVANSLVDEHSRILFFASLLVVQLIRPLGSSQGTYWMANKLLWEFRQGLKNMIQNESNSITTRIILMMKWQFRNGYLWL